MLWGPFESFDMIDWYVERRGKKPYEYHATNVGRDHAPAVLEWLRGGATALFTGAVYIERQKPVDMLNICFSVK
jgi:hypothetical protein